MQTLRHDYVHVNGIRLHYVTAGQGPLLVLLHGFPEFWYAWRHQITALAEDFTVVVPDQRGYGASDRPNWGYEVDVLVADLLGLIEALGHTNALLVGHDWGGAVAWAAAIAYPHRFTRLVIMNAPHPVVFGRHLRHNPVQQRRSWYMGFFLLPWLPELALSAADYTGLERLFRATARPGTFSEADLDAYKDAMSQTGALTAALNWYRSAGRAGARGLLSGRERQCRVPTLVIWGERDVALGAEMLDDLDEFVDDLQIVRIPEAGHWVQHEAPDEVTAALKAFLRQT
ncbi:MAG: alpha/beta fold hydrolase [Oscillochloridaceae bacterium umkhey_bin13]